MGWTAPGDTLRGVTPDLKLILLWLNLEKKHWINAVEDGSGEETTAKKVTTFRVDD